MLLAALGGCGGGAVRPGAWLHVTVMADGNARLDFFAAELIRSDAGLRTLALGLARDVFPQAGGYQVRTESDRGLPYARVRIGRAYRPERSVVLGIDTTGPLRRLTALGFTEVAVRLWLPAVPATVHTTAAGDRATAGAGEGALTWRLRKGGPPRDVRVVLRPSPGRWYAVLGLTLLCAAGTVVGLALRRRAAGVLAAAAAVAAMIATLAASGGKQGDNLGVAGLLDGRALGVATFAPLVTIPLGIVAALALAAAWARFVGHRAAAGSLRADPGHRSR